MSPFTQSIGRFTYEPATNWQGAFSPSIVFNANPQDAPIESHVLSQTGSYGKQLGVLIRAIDALQAGVDRSKLTPERQEGLELFDKLRKKATEAAEEYRERVSADDVVDLVKAFAAHRSDFEKRVLATDIRRILGE
jgi:CHAD domain-containing protein